MTNFNVDELAFDIKSEIILIDVVHTDDDVGTEMIDNVSLNERLSGCELDEQIGHAESRKGSETIRQQERR